MMTIFKEWDGALVKAALVEAYECEYDVGGRVGPRAEGTTMPQVSGPLGDDDDEGGPRKRFGRKPHEITRMEIVLYGWKDKAGRDNPAWMRFLADLPGPRLCLEIHSEWTAFWNLRDKDFNAKLYCQRKGLNYRTYRSRRDRGAEVIAFRLNEVGLQPWR